MVTVKKFIKMMKASGEERSKIIDKMSEQDAKDYLKIVMQELYPDKEDEEAEQV